MRKYKYKIAASVIVVVFLVFVFWYGGDAPTLRGWTYENKETHETSLVEKSTVTKNEESNITASSVKQENTPDEVKGKPQNQEVATKTEEEKLAMSEEIAENKQQTMQTHNETESTSPQKEKNDSFEEIIFLGKDEKSNQEYSREQGMVIDTATGKDKYKTEPVPVGKPIPVEPENSVITDKEFTCTLSVRCDTIIDNINWLDSEKRDIVPESGIIFEERTVTFYEGESVFNLLVREMKRNKIHMEFANVPIYNSAYIEGIANLYEFDCGELSGWMYKVNDWFPNYGCSRYKLKAGDKVEWVYTCDLGIDVGGSYSSKNGK